MDCVIFKILRSTFNFKDQSLDVSTTESWTENIAKEIIELHAFFQNWFNGTITQNEFTRFSDVIDSSFQIISPQGSQTNSFDLQAMLRNSYARDADIEISVADIRVKSISENIFLAIYREIQTSGPKNTSRISSALFRHENNLPNGYMWLHVHETWE